LGPGVDVLPVTDERGLFEAVAELVQVGREGGREGRKEGGREGGEGMGGCVAGER